jgi:hypothetical protein
MPDFQISRVRRPVLILGQIADDEIGLRQLRRAEPLDGESPKATLCLSQ